MAAHSTFTEGVNSSERRGWRGWSPGYAPAGHDDAPVNTSPWTPGYLGELGADGAPVAVVDVHGPCVLMLQRRPHDHVIEAVHVDVREGGDGGAEPRVFHALGAFQKLVPVQNALEKGRGVSNADLAASQFQFTASDGHTHLQAGKWRGLETQNSKSSSYGENYK